jgi:hypothetical protein
VPRFFLLLSIGISCGHAYGGGATDRRKNLSQHNPSMKKYEKTVRQGDRGTLYVRESTRCQPHGQYSFEHPG